MKIRIILRKFWSAEPDSDFSTHVIQFGCIYCIYCQGVSMIIRNKYGGAYCKFGRSGLGGVGIGNASSSTPHAWGEKFHRRTFDPTETVMWGCLDPDCRESTARYHTRKGEQISAVGMGDQTGSRKPHWSCSLLEPGRADTRSWHVGAVES